MVVMDTRRIVARETWDNAAGMSCPRCGFAEADGPACARCGVVFAKVRDRPASMPRTSSAPAASSATSWALVAAPVVLVLAALAALGHSRRKIPAETVTTPSGGTTHTAAATRDAPAPVIAIPPEDAATPPPDLVNSGIPESDAKAFAALAELLTLRRRISDANVEAAVALQARYPDDPVLRQLVLDLLLRLGSGLAAERRTAEAIAALRRAVALPWADDRARALLLSTLVASSDWPAVEAFAAECLRMAPRDGDACYALGFSLLRQDRNAEAIEALKRCDGGTKGQALLAHLQKTQDDESGMTERRLSHFHVRYDGETHEAVGHDVLRVLERHYATLVGTMDHEPRATIPVILFSREQYYNASGAPAWSGGNYDGTDGRIRVPIGGLSAGLSAEVESTLLHELTHAFIADKSDGVAPREIHEGLAQYMEGARVESRLSAEARAALAGGELRGVSGFYTTALSLVEYLVAVRGQGGMNDLLKAMAQTHNIDQAFQQVHGQSYAAVQRAWRQRLQQQYGS
jgi:hypothetical protein